MDHDMVCRVCLDRSDPKRPLLKACGCAGTVANIHYECLKMMIEVSGKSKCGICDQPWAGCHIGSNKKSFRQYLREKRLTKNFVLLLVYMFMGIILNAFTIVAVDIIDRQTLLKIRKYGGWLITLAILVSFYFIWQIVEKYLAWRQTNYRLVLLECTLKEKQA